MYANPTNIDQIIATELKSSSTPSPVAAEVSKYPLNFLDLVHYSPS